MDLKAALALREQEAANLYARLPAVLKAEAKRHHHSVYPWRDVAEKHPWCEEAKKFSELLLEITELKVEIKMAELADKGPPDLKLVRQRRSS